MSELPVPTNEPTTDPTPANDGSGADPAGTLRHVTVEDDEIAVCTMFPRELDADEMATQWITATGESFVSLAASR